MTSARAWFSLVGFSLLSLASTFAAAPEPPSRLFAIPAWRFTVDDEGNRWGPRGQLDSFGRFYGSTTSAVPEPVTLPNEALNRPLIHEAAWLAYQNLGPEVTANFRIVDEVFTIPIGARYYAPIAVRDDAKFD